MTYNTINDAVTMAGGGGTLLAGRYRVVKQLGQGGMGSVWLAEDTQLDNKPFAIKMLPSILVSNKRAYRQLKDEALVAMKLTHPNIVTLRAFEENNGNPFLVMDYVDGETLDDYLAEHCDDVNHVEHVERVERGSGGLPEDEAIRILKPIAAALDYAHGEGVVHRDVKPANIIIRKDGHPYILDFGIAREIQETMTRVTGKLSSGTLLYMSPEQLRGQSPKGVQDVYSFAAMVYECLRGEPPFSRGQIEYQILNEQPEPLNPDIAISGLVMQGLAKKPEDRPKTCVGVLEGATRRVETDDTPSRHVSSQVQTVPLKSSLAAAQGKPVKIPEYDRNYLPSDAKYQSDVVFKAEGGNEPKTKSGDATKSCKGTLSHPKKDYSFTPATKKPAIYGEVVFLYVLGAIFLVLVVIGIVRQQVEHREEELRRDAAKSERTERMKHDMEEIRMRDMRIADEARKAEEAAKADAERRAREDAERRRAEERRQLENGKPTIYLTASINGVRKQAEVFEGLVERNRRTPITVTVNSPLGAKSHFAVQLMENGTIYTGVKEYTSVKGRQNIDVEMKPVRVCRNCGGRLPSYLYEAKCPSCKSQLLR